MAKQFIKEVKPYVKLYKDTNTMESDYYEKR